MNAVPYVVANPSIRKCGNFGAFHVGGYVVRKVWPLRYSNFFWCYCSTLYYFISCVWKWNCNIKKVYNFLHYANR